MKPLSREEIIEAVSEGIKKHGCACGLSPDAQGEVAHLMGMAKDIGDGDRGRGIEKMRAAFKWWLRWQEMESMIGKIIVRAVTLALVGALLTIIGVKAFK